MKYFPYLRGKQFELIALRDMCEFIEEDSIISPIIEPIKTTNSTLIKTLKLLKDENVIVNFILNPKEGDLKFNGLEENLSEFWDIINIFDNIIPTFIIDDQLNWQNLNNCLIDYPLNNISLIIQNHPSSINSFLSFIEVNNIINIFLNDENSSRRIKRDIRDKCEAIILLADRFNQKEKNVDYISNIDEFFSDDHLYYMDEGYNGISDYLTIGSKYTDGGFLPYAVAIHLTYFDINEKLRMHHFVSDTNDFYDDTPNKVNEALKKLIDFAETHNINTKAVEEFKKIHKYESYPGLGAIKKLSILNHIELMYRYFVSELL